MRRVVWIWIFQRRTRTRCDLSRRVLRVAALRSQRSSTRTRCGRSRVRWAKTLRAPRGCARMLRVDRLRCGPVAPVDRLRCERTARRRLSRVRAGRLRCGRVAQRHKLLPVGRARCVRLARVRRARCGRVRLPKCRRFRRRLGSRRVSVRVPARSAGLTRGELRVGRQRSICRRRRSRMRSSCGIQPGSRSWHLRVCCWSVR